MKLYLVQILVVVANIQVKFLKAEEEKGFMRTAFDHELVDPKEQINFVNKHISFFEGIQICVLIPKGKKFNITLLSIG